MTARRDQLRRFWCQIAAGVSPVDAGGLIGVSATSARRWFGEAGGMPPLSLSSPAPAPHGRLTIEERELILAGISRDETVHQIARQLGRAASTISRELRANMTHQRYGQRPRWEAAGRPRGVPPSPPWRYSPHRAQLRADRLAARPKPAKLATCARLREEVETKLKDEHSPEQISNRLRLDFPDDPAMRISHEAIYRSLYVQGKGGLARDLTARLRTGRALRKPRRRADTRTTRRIPDMVMIAERPPEADDRAVPGHWEGDLIVGANSASAIGTLVERASRFVALLHLPGSHGADAVQAAMTDAMANLPATLRKTLTWDQGIEMRNHAKIADVTGLAVYFCDPHSPWQRGSNENTNGLLRQYFPKGSDLSVYAPDYLDHVARKLNTRPRKTLGWKTPAEALDQLLSNPPPPGVAMTA